jgi:hypothetical protein
VDATVYSERACEHCGKRVRLNRYGQYRRHFTADPDGRRHLCAASGREPAGIVRLLTAEPTLEDSLSHALQLLRGLDP